MVGLNGGMPEQQLDLLERAAGLAAEPGAGSSEVVGCQVPQLETAGIPPSQSPTPHFR